MLQPALTVVGRSFDDAAMRIEIARLHEQLSATMIYVTHDQVEAMTLADRIVVLRAGRIVVETYNPEYSLRWWARLRASRAGLNGVISGRN